VLGDDGGRWLVGDVQPPGAVLAARERRLVAASQRVEQLRGPEVLMDVGAWKARHGGRQSLQCLPELCSIRQSAPAAGMASGCDGARYAA
jgi:hypothetical protein